MLIIAVQPWSKLRLHGESVTPPQMPLQGPVQQASLHIKRRSATDFCCLNWSTAPLNLVKQFYSGTQTIMRNTMSSSKRQPVSVKDGGW